jgi:AcrR family transcriptional regulator
MTTADPAPTPDAAPRRGRPRGADRGTSGAVLAAAAELFSAVGYTATSTYAIAERAGVKQASIYHHFRGKGAILQTLLLGTVRPPLALAEHLVDAPGSAAARLWALCDADARLLADGPVNVGALMQLPEVAGGDLPALDEFRDLRARLRDRYDALVAAVLVEAPGRGPGPAAGTLVFGLVESVITGRREGGVARVAAVAPLVADAALRVLGLDPAQVAAAREEAGGLVLPPVVPVTAGVAPGAPGVDERTAAPVPDVG